MNRVHTGVLVGAHWRAGCRCSEVDPSPCPRRLRHVLHPGIAQDSDRYQRQSSTQNLLVPTGKPHSSTPVLAQLFHQVLPVVLRSTQHHALVHRF